MPEIMPKSNGLYSNGHSVMTGPVIVSTITGAENLVRKTDIFKSNNDECTKISGEMLCKSM